MFEISARSAPGRAWLAALAIAAIATPAALAAPAEAKPPRSFYGVVPQFQLAPDDYKKMGTSRVGTLRTPLVWSLVDPSALPGDEQWGPYDTLVGSAALNGVKVLPTLTTTPDWVSRLDDCRSQCPSSPPRSGLALAAWRDFLRSAVGRYGPGGSFWLENPTIPARPIRAWQIWNEQNSPTYFTPRPDVPDYAALVTEASRAIKGADPGAEVILGGMFYSPGGGAPPALLSTTYLKRLYREPGIASRFDGVAVHPYAQSFRDVKLQVELLREVSRKAGDRKVGYWITEIGWAAGRIDHPLVVGKKRQASKLRQAFRYFTRNRKRLNIRQIDWFSWRDSPPGLTLCVWCPESGLFTRQDFAPRPALKAFKKFTRRRG